jgi:hypothetical protein
MLWRWNGRQAEAFRMVSETFALAVSRCTRQQVTAPCGSRYRFLAAFRVVFFFAVFFFAVFFAAVFFLAIKPPWTE